MSFNFKIDPSAMTSEGTIATIIVVLLAAIIFIAIPVALAIREKRLTIENKQSGLYLMIGVFASAILFGLYSVLVGLVLLIVHLAVLRNNSGKSVTLKADPTE